MFYRHPQMADKHLNKCKSCTKKDTKERYYSKEGREKVIAYEKKREQDPERKAKKRIYQQRVRAKSKGKYRARNKVSHAIRDGRLKRKPCEVCGNMKSEVHHKDYRKYLDVIWLCRKHHMIIEGKIPF